MREKYTHEIDERHKLEDERVHTAQAAANTQLNKLRGHLLRLGRRATFRALFDAVTGDMPTLSGTLKTARRLGVVKFDGEHLLQGRDDGVAIELLDLRPADEFVHYETKVSDKGHHASHEQTDPFAIDLATHTTAPCARCKQPVMLTERVGVQGLILHRRCFECYLDRCTIQLIPARYACLEVEGEMRFYCVPHYNELFKIHGDYSKGFVDAGVKKSVRLVQHSDAPESDSAAAHGDDAVAAAAAPAAAAPEAATS
jgi:hypothetical protein